MADIREATPDDVEGLAALADRRRAQYARYQPQLWRESPDAPTVHRRLLAEIVVDPRVITVVALESGGEVVGFVTARLVQPSPLHAPGGPTGFVDDFTVARADLWSTVGVALLRAVVIRAAARQVTQLVVVCGHRDELKRAALAQAGLGIASEWWTASIGQPLSPTDAALD